jgi:type IX secretion system PorP/SprF family membrane protein
MMRNIIILFCVLLFEAKAGFSQDPHFSQYYASPALINPASTGIFNGDMRLAGIYRQQWPQYGEAFVTGSFAFEIKPGKFKNDEETDRLAYGGMLMFDKTPDGILKSQYAYGMFAYHKGLDEAGHKKLGVGIMIGYDQRSVDGSQLTFASQFESGGFNNTIPSGETFSYRRISSLDAHAGLLYSYNDENRSFYAGGSVYHLASPKNYFLQNNKVEKTIPKRWDLNAGINLASDNFRYAASTVIMYQAASIECMVGGAIGIPYGEDGILYLGSWFRAREALIPTVNLQWQNLNLGFSYDVFVNNKTMAKPKSFEFSISYRPKQYSDRKTGCASF